MDVKCVTCGKVFNTDTDLRDQLSKKEYSISGMCQECQDSIFGTNDNDNNDNDWASFRAPDLTPQIMEMMIGFVGRDKHNKKSELLQRIFGVDDDYINEVINDIELNVIVYAVKADLTTEEILSLMGDDAEVDKVELTDLIEEVRKGFTP